MKKPLILFVAVCLYACGAIANSNSFIPDDSLELNALSIPNNSVLEDESGGLCPTQDLDCWKEAAQQGDAEAQFCLGSRYYSGEGVHQNIEQAYYWWQQAAQQGHFFAQFNLQLRVLRPACVCFVLFSTILMIKPFSTLVPLVL